MSRLWDQKIGRWLAGMIAGTWVRPNHVTGLDLVVGLACGGVIAAGHPRTGALLFLIARLLDCVDGELARLQGTASKFGEYFDLVAGTATYVSLFAGLAVWSYINADSGYVTILLSLAIAAVFANGFLLLIRTKLLQDPSEEFPTIGSFNLEDGAYLIPVAIWFGFPFETFAVVSIGATLFVVWHAVQTGSRALLRLEASR